MRVGTLPHMWVDSHCHLQLAEHASADDLIARAGAVDWMVVPGVDRDSSVAAIELAQRSGGRLLATAGLHPHDAERWADQAEAIAGLMNRVVAVGETGLDYYRDLSPRADQRASFQAHIELAAASGLPLIVHCRDAFADVFSALEAAGLGQQAVLHCWTGGPKWTKRFLGIDPTFSFAGPVAFATGDTVRRAAAVVPPTQCLVETDTPYLSPEPFRGEPNEPSRVALVGAALGRVWGLAEGEVAAITTANATRVFRS